MSSLVAEPSPAERAACPSGGAPAPAAHGRLAARADLLMTLAVGGLLIAVAFLARGGAALPTTTTAAIGLTLLGAGAVAVAALAAPGRRLWGGTTLLLFGVLTALTGLSIVWSVAPDGLVARGERHRRLSRRLRRSDRARACRGRPLGQRARWRRARCGLRVRLRAAREGLPVDPAARPLRTAARPVRLLERGRADGGARDPRLPVARRTSRGPCSAQRACGAAARSAARRAAARGGSRAAARGSGRGRLLVRGGPVAPARARRARGRGCRRGGGGARGRSRRRRSAPTARRSTCAPTAATRSDCCCSRCCSCSHSPGSGSASRCRARD